MRMSRIWIIHLTTLLSLAVWAAADPAFSPMVRSRSLSVASVDVGWIRLVGFSLVTVIAVSSLMSLFVKLLRPSPDNLPDRSLRQLLSITAVIAVWCSLALHHDSIAWQGKRVRFACRVSELEAIAAPLREEWPQRDGELSKIGPFMAYPFGRPTTLVLLQAPRVAGHLVYVSAVECNCDGAIKLQLTGTDGGDWAEWHPPHSQPSSFVGGLAEPHELTTATAIGRGWYLVRYRA